MAFAQKIADESVVCVWRSPARALLRRLPSGRFAPRLLEARLHRYFERVSLEPEKHVRMFESFAPACRGRIAPLVLHRSSAFLSHDQTSRLKKFGRRSLARKSAAVSPRACRNFIARIRSAKAPCPRHRTRRRARRSAPATTAQALFPAMKGIHIDQPVGACDGYCRLPDWPAKNTAKDLHSAPAHSMPVPVINVLLPAR